VCVPVRSERSGRARAVHGRTKEPRAQAGRRPAGRLRSTHQGTKTFRLLGKSRPALNGEPRLLLFFRAGIRCDCPPGRRRAAKVFRFSVPHGSPIRGFARPAGVLLLRKPMLYPNRKRPPRRGRPRTLGRANGAVRAPHPRTMPKSPAPMPWLFGVFLSPLMQLTGSLGRLVPPGWECSGNGVAPALVQRPWAGSPRYFFRC